MSTIFLASDDKPIYYAKYQLLYEDKLIFKKELREYKIVKTNTPLKCP